MLGWIGSEHAFNQSRRIILDVLVGYLGEGISDPPDAPFSRTMN